VDVAYVVYVASVSETCCKCLFKMFHLFQKYVASVLIWMFAYVSSVSDVCCKCFIWICCVCYNDYVASICSKYFICFSCILQLFYLSVVKVDLNVGLFSEEERASAGAMAALGVSWRQRSTRGRAGIHAGARGLFPYDMLPTLAPPGVLEHKLVASPRATEMRTLAMEVMRARRG
jgi:hypothetical protein